MTRFSWYQFTLVTPNLNRHCGYVYSNSHVSAQFIVEKLHGDIVQLKKAQWLSLNFKISQQQLGQTISIVGDMLGAGMPLLDALRFAAKSNLNKNQTLLINHWLYGLTAGLSLSSVLSRMNGLFSCEQLALILAAEKTGQYAQAFQKIDNGITNRALFLQRIKAAASYPLILLLAGIFTLVGLLTFVVPKFSELFITMNKPLPYLTTQLILFSESVTQYGASFLTLAMTLLIVVLNLLLKTYWGNRLLLTLPLAGRLYGNILTMRVAVISASMYSAGIPLQQVLTTIEQSTRSKLLKHSLTQLRYQLQHGESLAAGFTASGLFPSLFNEFIRVGEKSGTLDTSLVKMSEYYQQQVENALNSVVKWLQPSLILILGVMIGVIVMAMYLPMFDLAELY